MGYPSFNVRGVKYKAVSATADGDNTLVAAPGVGLRILVLGYHFRFTGPAGGEAVTVKSGAAGTTHLVDVAGSTPFGVSRIYTGTDSDAGAFICDENAALVVNNAVGVDTLGHITFRIVSVNYA